MLKKLAILLAPDSAAGAAATATSPASPVEPSGADPGDSDPSAISGWMKSLPILQDAPEPTAPAQAKNADPAKEPVKETTDGKPNADATGGKPAGKPAASVEKPDAGKVDDKAKPATDAAKTDPKKEAAKKPDEIDPEKWPRSANDWDKFKKARAAKESEYQARIKEQSDKITQLETEFKTVQEKASKVPEADPTTKAEIDRLTKLVEQYSERIQQIDVTQEPRFQKYFNDKVEEQIVFAKGVVGAERAEAIEKALKLPDTPEFRVIKKEAINDAVADLDEFDRAQIGGVIKSLYDIGRERESEIKKAKDHAETLKAQGATRQQQARATLEKMFTDLAGQLGDDKAGVAIYQKRNKEDGTPDVDWNRGVEERIASAKRLMFGGKDLKPQEVIQASLHAAAYPIILEAYKADKQEWEDKIAMLESQVAELTAAQPGKAKGVGTTGPNGEPPKRDTTPTKETNPFDAARNFARSIAEGMQE